MPSPVSRAGEMELHVVGKNSRNQDIRSSSSSASLWILREQGNAETHLLPGVIPNQQQEEWLGRHSPFPRGYL